MKDQKLKVHPRPIFLCVFEVLGIDVALKNSMTGIKALRPSKDQQDDFTSVFLSASDRDCHTFDQVIKLLSQEAYQLRWSKVFHWANFFIPYFSHEEKKQIHLLSFRLRALIYEKQAQNEESHLREYLKKNRGAWASSSLSAELKMEITLTKAAIYRYLGQNHRSWFQCKRALNFLGISDHHRGEFLFGMALSLSNMGKNYEALVCYEKLQKLKSASLERKQLALLNEAYLRLQISDVQSCKQILNNLPEGREVRLGIMMQLLEEGVVEEKNFESLSCEKVPHSEKSRLWIYLAESLLLNSGEKRDGRHQKLISFLEKEPSSLAQAVRGLLAGESLNKKPFFSNIFDEVDFKYLHILSRDEKDSSLLKDYEELDNLLQKQKIHDPLIPRIEVLKFPKYKLHVLISQKVFAQALAKPLIHFCSRTQSLYLNGERWSFSKNPKTWALIRTLTESHELVDKKQIHSALSGNKYVERLHDGRLWMLLKRFRSQMIEKWQIDPLRLPGDRKIYLNVKFLKIS